jgi:putative flippase GtrA
MREGNAGLRLVEAAWSLRLSRFVLIGIASTVLYAVLAFVFAPMEGLDATGASVLAFAFAAAFSYAGHKYVTFVSGGAHRLELPRFVVLSASGLAVASLLPAVLSGFFGLPVAVPILLACITIPAVNYVVLGKWVFREMQA